MARTRHLKGDKVTFTIDGADLTLDATRAILTHAEDNEGLVTFKAAKEGGVFKGTLSVTAAQSDDADSWETFVWENQGDEVPFVLRRQGTEGRQFSGVIKIAGFPDAGGDAGDGYLTFAMDFEVIGKVTRGALPTA